MMAARFSGTAMPANRASIVASSSARSITSPMSDETNSGTPSVRSCRARTKASPGDVVDELDGGPVAPVQVFGDQQQRPLLRVAIQQFAHLSQHTLRADASEFAAQRVAPIRAAQPRQLQQPGRCHSAQQRRQRGVAATQLGQRLQYRQIGLAGAIVLYAMTARAGDAAEAGDEMLDQRGLADPRPAGEPDQRTLAPVRPLPGPVQP